MEYALIKTTEGDMLAYLYSNNTPNTVNNFKGLAKSGGYKNNTFHRVIPGFMAQGGSIPTAKQIPCELKGGNQYHDSGVLSMAHAGRDTGSSQFFVCHARQSTQHLDNNHTAFGRVVEGLDVIPKIKQGTQILDIEIVEL